MTESNNIISILQKILKTYDSIITASTEISNYFDTLESIPVEVVNYLKGIVQKEALDAWRTNNRIGLIAMATGTGKSKIVVDYTTLLHLNGIDCKCLIIVPTEQLRDINWQKEFIKWNREDVYETLYKECYASIHNIKDEDYNLIVLDEGHNITEANSQFFNQNKTDEILVLTATPPTDPIKKQILSNLGIKTVYELPLDIAVKLRLVSPYEITIVETSLDTNDKYIKAGTKAKPFLTTEKGMYDYLTKKISNFMYGSMPNKEKLLQFAILRRLRFIYNLRSKLQAAQYIVTMLSSEERTLIFCGSIEQANALSSYSYHSKTNDTALNAFIKQEINILSCVKALNEGINIPEINNAIVVQLDSNERNLVQRLGRGLRYTENHLAKMIIIVCKDTVDMKWVNKAIIELGEKKIRRINYSDLLVGNSKL